ncbi:MULTISPECIES: YbfB/YjiJ family MFS transporter [Halomonadaceae]|uniref:YbfB/YjiJ family MFS transporter n=1 Tax=Halomonadaceae TaxID=28256 RepID=UPI001597FCF7|nr:MULTISPECIES: YbfB/YjiJ family MFS transporter [Halomonas]QJQ95125.1 YbfB/YjiJ family MFS transporter [Halomonas sp. PA5]
MLHKHDLPALLTGIMATLAGIGIARFAYTPLLPALIEQGWFTASQAAYLGAANLLGYFIGALTAHRLSEHFRPRWVLAGAFAAIGLSFLLCASPAPFAWFFIWRLVSGVAGAILMVVGPSMALAATVPERKASVGALVFSGIGLGALIAATVVPLLLEYPLAVTWLALGGVSLLAGGICDRGVTRLDKPAGLPSLREGGDTRQLGALVVIMVIAAYGLDAAGFVPHTVFWVDYLTREAELGHEAASLQWAMFGIGAVVGPLLAGLVAKRLGWHTGLALAFLAKALAVAIPLISLSLVSRSISSLVVGAMIPGIVALTSGRLAELVGPRAHKRLWGYATATFAAAQAASGYGMSALYATTGTYHPLFGIGSSMLAVGCLLLLFSRNIGATAESRPLA